jgi:hypothetical protein
MPVVKESANEEDVVVVEGDANPMDSAPSQRKSHHHVGFKVEPEGEEDVEQGSHRALRVGFRVESAFELARRDSELREANIPGFIPDEEEVVEAPYDIHQKVRKRHFLSIINTGLPLHRVPAARFKWGQAQGHPPHIWASLFFDLVYVGVFVVCRASFVALA